MLVYLLAVSAVIYIPSIQHFIPPLSYCLLADICNHTWISECGVEEIKNKRLFIDECDMFEYNCDYNRKYEIANYTDCFAGMLCPTLPPPKYLRIGNYQVMRDDRRRMVFAPTKATIPMHLRNGKRRYTPKPGRKLKSTKNCQSCTSFIQKPVQKPSRRAQQTTTRFTRTTPKVDIVILQRISVMKNGKMMIKVVKGTAPVTKSVDTQKRSDSDFIE